jgi:L-asparaginase II
MDILLPFILTETRGSAAENDHSLMMAFWRAGVNTLTEAEDTPWIFARSTTKPFQVLPLLQTLPDLPPAMVALCCGSHSGTPQHQALVQQVLALGGVTLDALQCGTHYPTDKTTRIALYKAEAAPSLLHHNCSGKHAGMLLCCTRQQWPLATYLDKDHPLQQAILATVQALTGSTLFEMAIDGCGAPTFGMPLGVLALLYAQLARNPTLAPVVKAMQQHPHYLGGPGRIDTAIIEASHGQVLAKVGADGVMAMAHIPTGTGCAFKVGSGNEVIRNHVSVRCLLDRQWLTPNQLTPDLMALADKTRYNAKGQAIGAYVLTNMDDDDTSTTTTFINPEDPPEWLEVCYN